ncbi:TPR-like protein [Suillus lakei]|nr:TPR-like protein [Suillus lakei]
MSGKHVCFNEENIIHSPAVEKSRAALQRCPPGHSRRSACLYNLAINLHNRFQQEGVTSDLDEAIELHRAALVLRPPNSQQGVLSDLDEAIEFHRAALPLRPPTHSLRSWSLHNIAISLIHRFERRGIPSDLDEAIECHRAALLLRSFGHSDRSASLNALAISLQHRFKQRDITSDLDEAIELQREALPLCHPSHSDPSMSFNNLAVSLLDRFQQQGVLSDLDEAIEFHRAALLLRPPGHSDRSTSLNHLANSLRARFELRGGLFDLDEVIELHRAALLLGHSDRFTSLNNLANSLRARFEQRGVASDLDEVIELHRAALLLGHSDRFTSLNNLANSQRARFEQRGVASDLDEIIELHRAALLLGHSDRFTSLNNLANSLRARFEQRGVASDLDEVIELHRAALLLGHSDRFTSLNNLANSLRARFEQRGVASDLDEVIELHRAALICPPDHPLRSSSLTNLAISLRDKFQQWGVPSGLDEAFRPYVQLFHLTHAASRSDIGAARSWTNSTKETNHGSALVANQIILQFLDHLVALFPSPSRPDVVKEDASSPALDAFSCGLGRYALMTAVELLEQDRVVFWTQLARFRSPLDELSQSGDTGAALAEEFKQLSLVRLRNALDQSIDDQSPHIRQLTMQWDGVVSRIRMFPEFSGFLLPLLFSDLQKAAEEGPVIIVKASQYSSDALIILNAQDPVHVPLGIMQTDVSELSSKFQSLVGGPSNHVHELVGILRKIWYDVVDPVVQALRESEVHPGSRIWWCPTAEFRLLPIHAAGPYETKEDNLSDIYISSYTPTLAALIRARQRVSQDVSPQHFVAVGQGSTPSGKQLQYVAPELAIVAQRVAPIVSFTSLADSKATVQGVLDALSRNQWLHLAGCAIPNREQPFESSFAMHDGPLMIKDIIQSHWQNAEFAFLSASDTSVGGGGSPDESIHFAAAMQFSGFRSVIGSMRSVDDGVAQQIVSAFYGYLVDGSGRLDCTRAAVALHKAMKSLRKKIPFEQQITFVHMGV